MSIDFKSTKGIFLQIADNICHQILEGKLNAGDRVPSVRDLAMEYEVNRNTILRTYSILDDMGVFDNKRGVGFFVSDDAVNIIRKKEKDEFFKNYLPDFINKVKILKLTEEDMVELFNLIKQNSHEKE